MLGYPGPSITPPYFVPLKHHAETKSVLFTATATVGTNYTLDSEGMNPKAQTKANNQGVPFTTEEFHFRMGKSSPAVAAADSHPQLKMNVTKNSLRTSGGVVTGSATSAFMKSPSKHAHRHEPYGRDSRASPYLAPAPPPIPAYAKVSSSVTVSGQTNLFGSFHIDTLFDVTPREKHACPVAECGKRYVRESDLRSHFTLQHPSYHLQYPDLISIGKYRCEVCGARFSRRKILAKHVNQHKQGSSEKKDGLLHDLQYELEENDDSEDRSSSKEKEGGEHEVKPETLQKKYVYEYEEPFNAAVVSPTNSYGESPVPEEPLKDSKFSLSFILKQ